MGYNRRTNKLSKISGTNDTVPMTTSVPKISGTGDNNAVMFAEKEYLAREVSTGNNYAYLKIGEGCSNMCTYCAIPYIRGLFVSRPMDDI